jgi:hypothetical protein
LFVLAATLTQTPTPQTAAVLGVMFKEDMISRFELSSIWEDESLLEIRVHASNAQFSGTANCYTNRIEIEKIADLLNGYPESLDHKVIYSSGPSDNHSYFTCEFMPTHQSGHFKVNIKIVHIETFTHSYQEKGVVELEFNIEPAAVDAFVSSLKTLAKSGVGEAKAVLNGAT